MSQRPKKLYLVVIENDNVGDECSNYQMIIIYARDSEEARELAVAKPSDLVTPISSPDARAALRPYFRKRYIDRLIECGDYTSNWVFTIGS